MQKNRCVFSFVQSVRTIFSVSIFSVPKNMCKHCSVQRLLCGKGSVCKSAYVPLFMCAKASLYKATVCKKKKCVKTSVCKGVYVYFFFAHKPLCVRIPARKNCSV